MVKKYAIIHGCNKNVGDFLIREKAKTLLKHFHPDCSFLEIHGSKGADNSIEDINNSDLLILAGGPAVKHNSYPQMHPLVKNLEDIKVPFISIGIGSDDFPGTEYNLFNYKLSKSSIEFFKKMELVGLRDYFTEKILKKNGVDKVVMTGCPAWYDLKSIGKEFRPLKKVNKIAFSVGGLKGQKKIYFNQHKRVMNLISEKFPKAEKYVMFHRGYDYDEHSVSKKQAVLFKKLKKYSEELGFKVKDLSYDIKEIKIYDKIDLHIGYRVHGHILTLSKRKPSLLIAEDSRGKGVLRTLGTPYLQAWENTLLNSLIERLTRTSFLQEGLKYSLKAVKTNPFLLEQLSNLIDEEIASNFNNFTGLGRKIDNHFKTMKKVIQSL